MKTKTLLTVVFVVVAGFNSVHPQTTCKVLKPSISGTYTGACKRDYAHGKGEAIGIDKYIGEFKKGFPDGIGTYYWQTGEIFQGQWKNGLRNGKGEFTFTYMGRDSLLTGIWKGDKYAGERLLASYVIEYKNSIGRVTCIKVGDRPYVQYKFSPRGGVLDNTSNLFLQGSSGSETASTSFVGFDQVTFPFKGKITFNAPNSLNTAMLTCELRFLINEPGSWVVTLFY